ncbi:MAG: Gfo/Idh/MocA family oxidoreductase [Balneolaceae bacterium]|nr:Gfo/Idh/MocA family oxidoreductase [Balneolaceae bacterium]
MIIVDKALEERERQGKPVNVGLIGAGYMGRGAVLTIENYIPGMRVAAIYNRTLSRAKKAYEQAKINDYKNVNSAGQLVSTYKGRHLYNS